MNPLPLLSVVLLATISSDLAASVPARPNVVVLLVDDLGWGDVSCLHPGGAVKTPNLDRIARTGVKFTNGT